MNGVAMLKIIHQPTTIESVGQSGHLVLMIKYILIYMLISDIKNQRLLRMVKVEDSE